MIDAPNPWIAIGVSIIALIFVIATYARASRWRETDEGQRTIADISGLKDRLTKVETKLSDMPSKADFATLEAQLEGFEKMLRNTEAGVQRIEGYMMEKSR